MKVLLLVAGGAIGTLARYSISRISGHWLGTEFPWGTLMVNIGGSFLIGLIWGILQNFPSDHGIRLFLMVGLMGGFTTFSSFSLESLGLFRDGNINMALLNIFLNNFLGLILVWAGYFVSVSLFSWVK